MSNNILQNPLYFHREYKNDFPEVQKNRDLTSGALRIGKVALPFIALYQPFGRTLACGLSASRAINTLGECFSAKDYQDLSWAMLSTGLALGSVAGTIFLHPLGMLITTLSDIGMNLNHVYGAISRGEMLEAGKETMRVANNSFYLAMMVTGSVQLQLASVALQVIVEGSASYEEFNKDNLLEAAGHLGMSMVRMNQSYRQLGQLQQKWKAESISKNPEIREEGVVKSAPVHPSSRTPEETEKIIAEYKTQFSDTCDKGGAYDVDTKGNITFVHKDSSSSLSLHFYDGQKWIVYPNFEFPSKQGTSFSDYRVRRDETTGTVSLLIEEVLIRGYEDGIWVGLFNPKTDQTWEMHSIPEMDDEATILGFVSLGNGQFSGIFKGWDDDCSENISTCLFGRTEEGLLGRSIEGKFWHRYDVLSSPNAKIDEVWFEKNSEGCPVVTWTEHKELFSSFDEYENLFDWLLEDVGTSELAPEDFFENLRLRDIPSKVQKEINALVREMGNILETNKIQTACLNRANKKWDTSTIASGFVNNPKFIKDETGTYLFFIGIDGFDWVIEELKNFSLKDSFERIANWKTMEDEIKVAIKGVKLNERWDSLGNVCSFSLSEEYNRLLGDYSVSRNGDEFQVSWIN